MKEHEHPKINEGLSVLFIWVIALTIIITLMFLRVVEINNALEEENLECSMVIFDNMIANNGIDFWYEDGEDIIKRDICGNIKGIWTIKELDTSKGEDGQ